MTAYSCRRADCTDIAAGRGFCVRHYQDARKRLIAYGRWDAWVDDTTMLRDHLDKLTLLGLSVSRISLLAGVSAPTITAIIAGSPSRVRRLTADRLLAVDAVFDDLPATNRIAATGTHRRLQALITLGWSQSRLDGLLSFSRGRVNHILHRNRVLVAHHRAIAALFDELWDLPVPERTIHERRSTTRARRQAAQNRWLPPLAWDDLDTDPEPPLPLKPAAEIVDERDVELACSGQPVQLSYAGRRAAVTRLSYFRLSDPQIAERLGLSSRTVLRIRHSVQRDEINMEELIVA